MVETAKIPDQSCAPPTPEDVRPSSPPRSHRGPARATNVLGFALFILVNAALFLRPGEVVAGWAGAPVFEVLILVCLAVSVRPFLEQLAPRSLAARPITVCVAGLLLAVILSRLSILWDEKGRQPILDFTKVLTYYLLLVAVVNSTARLHQFLLWLVGFAAVLTGLAVLQYHKVIDLPAFAPIAESTETGAVIQRLSAAGIYSDPNDLSLLLVIGAAVCLYLAGSRRFGLFRFLWLAPLGLFVYSLVLTQSRGGLMAMVAAILVFVGARFGWLIAIPLVGGSCAFLYRFIPSRQTDFDGAIAFGTAQIRIQLWKEGLKAFWQAPLFGIGAGEYAQREGAVVHNSFIHCYTELGFVGGTLFLGAFCFALWSLSEFRLGRVHIPNVRLKRLRPYLMAVVAGYAVGLLSLSRQNVAPTYMVLGLVTVYLRLATRFPNAPDLRFDPPLVLRLVLVSAAFLSAAQWFVHLTLR